MAFRFNTKKCTIGKFATGKIRKRFPPIPIRRRLLLLQDSDIEKFSQEPLIATDQMPEKIDQQQSRLFIDFKKAAFAKLKIELTGTGAESVVVTVGEMVNKDHLSIDSLQGRNIRYYKTELALKSGTHWYEIAWPRKLKKGQ
jgi:hypothetical protein